MSKTLALASISAFFALTCPVLAEQGDTSSYGTVGWGPVIPTQALTPRDRSWNHQNQAKYEAEAGAEWLREHGKGFAPF